MPKKPFQNPRSTRETKLCEQWPEHIVCQWIGNSKMVAREHHLLVRDEDLERAAAMPTNMDAHVTEVAANVSGPLQRTVHGTAQLAAVLAGNESPH